MQSLFIGIGELLWDLLPSGRQLGGAPANFAYISSLLGNRAVIVSRIGDDDLGSEARARCSSLGLDISHLQTDPERPTGTVNVKIDSQGQPEFEIVEDVAWDNITSTVALQMLAAKADVVCFGSLAQRREPSRGTIQQFLRGTRQSCLRIFDVNLRQTFWDAVTLKTGFALSNVVKMNHIELPIVMNAVGLSPTEDEEAGSRELLEHYGLELICVTRGASGSMLVGRKGKSDHSGFRVKVADTVGAGDAFTAALAHGYRSGLSLDAINEASNRMGSWVASQSGATPSDISDDLLRVVAGR
jgi:fructokinase